MKLSDSQVLSLSDKLKLSAEELTQHAEEAKKTSVPLQTLLIDREVITNENISQLYAESIGIPFVKLDPKELVRSVVETIPERIARQYNAIIFQTDEDGSHHLAIVDPEDLQSIEFIRKFTSKNIIVNAATTDNIQNCLQVYRQGTETDELNKIVQIESDETKEEVISESDITEDSPIAKTVNLILEYAIRSDASDIHIEPRDDYVSIRYRIDGVLQEANKLPKNIHGALISRIKILSNLKIDERRVPQDGRFKINLSNRAFAFRVSTLPITTGEKVVMRILNESSKALSLHELGYWGVAKERIENAIIQPHGMMLVTGPTGSGKSTSLFSALSMLNSPKVNISTVEDPVEYKIPGANQTQVNPVAGMTFITGLRALLRQDPNIIMVGEIRDGETANLAVQAALTGHLVFSTLHTNNAATCLPRLLDMGIEPFLIASTVRAVVGQRLVRRLCTECRVQYAPEQTELDEITRLFGLDGTFTFATLAEYEAVAAKEEIGGNATEQPISMQNSQITSLYKAKDGGCKECNETGFTGRMGIYEVLSLTQAVQKLIVTNATSDELQKTAIADGMVTMQMDGLVKSLRGLTSIEEILRVTRE